MANSTIWDRYLSYCNLLLWQAGDGHEMKRMFTWDQIMNAAATLTLAHNASVAKDGTLTTVEDNLSLEQVMKANKR